ncbi:MAG: Nif11-like leader peptide family natural product precursor [Atopobiaceae bacterium]|nr:Nif11-like leader peptide family natural product precursor [Atopobiaceae bacterium]
MDFDILSEEQKAKARACKTPEDMLALAREEGYELSEDELDAVSGGGFWTEEKSNFATTQYDCNKLECNSFGCDRVTCGRITCAGYDHK